MKKIYFFLLLICCQFLSFGQTISIDNITYNTTDGGATYEVVSSTGYSGALDLGNIDNNGTLLNVTSIGTNAFYECYGLTAITMPNSVTNIGSYAFYFCTGLTTVNRSNAPEYPVLETTS